MVQSAFYKYIDKLWEFIAQLWSLNLWRLIALIGKRVLTILRLFVSLPFFFLPLSFFLQFLRAFLRIINYIKNTEHKNFGETRKFCFSLFKVFISIFCFVLCFFMPISAALAGSFLAYSVVKLLDSSLVYVYSIFAHLLIPNTAENAWRRAQYWDNITKHLSILALGATMTALIAIMQAHGLIMAVVWLSPLNLLALSIIGMVTLASCGYLFTLLWRFSQNLQSKTVFEIKANLKKFVSLFVCWIGALFLVSLAFAMPPAFAIGWIIGLLTFCNLFDISKSTYDYMDKNKVAEPAPLGLNLRNLFKQEKHCYYGIPNMLILHQEDSSAAKRINAIKLTFSLLIKAYRLEINCLKPVKMTYSSRIPFYFASVCTWWQKEKRQNKMEALLNALFKSLKGEPKTYQMAILIVVAKLAAHYCNEAKILAVKNCQPMLADANKIVQNLQRDVEELFYLFSKFEDQAIIIKTVNDLLEIYATYTHLKQENTPLINKGKARQNEKESLHNLLYACASLPSNKKEKKQKQEKYCERANLMLNSFLSDYEKEEKLKPRSYHPDCRKSFFRFRSDTVLILNSVEYFIKTHGV